MDLILILAGLLLLVFGGDYLVKGATGIALKFDIPPMLVGMTIVALGTSAPELVVSLKAALDGKPDISVGNVVGWTILPMLRLILGVTTMIFPIGIQKRIQSRLGSYDDGQYYFLSLRSDGGFPGSREDSLFPCSLFYWSEFLSASEGLQK